MRRAPLPARGRFDQGAGEHILDFAVGGGFKNVVVPLLVCVVGHQRVAHVVDEQLALNEIFEGREGNKTGDFGQRRTNGTEALKIAGKLAVGLGADCEGVFSENFGGRGGNGAANRNADEANVRLKIVETVGERCLSSSPWR